MDNNNFTGPMSQPAPQPMPEMPAQSMSNQPIEPPANMSGQPMSGQPVMSQGQPYPNQYPPQFQPPYPYPGQPYQQPAPKPPKQPMDPAKKKRIIIIVSICSAVLILGIAAAIIIPILLRVDYGSAYNTAKELKPKIYDIYRDYDCEYVVEYISSKYTDIKTYAKYVDGCKEVFNSDTDDLVTQLENTSGVKRNNKISDQFAKFKAEYTSVLPGGREDLNAKLALWQAKHNFLYAMAQLNYGSSESELKSAANCLINSGNDAIKAYGEGYLEHAIKLVNAYKAYRDSSGSNRSQLYEEYTSKKQEFDDWIEANRLNVEEIAPLNFDDTSKMYDEFKTLYDLIVDTYESNYNFGSGDCTEYYGIVYCD